MAARPRPEPGPRHAGALLPLFARNGLLQPSPDPEGTVDAEAEVPAQSPAAGVVLGAQLGFIELLQRSHNVALREHLLPDLLDGSLAGAPALSSAYALLSHGVALPVRGVETPRGWRLSGHLGSAANLQHEGHAVALPVAFDGLKDFAFVLLGSEENGLTRSPEAGRQGPPGIRAAALALSDVHFREDELLHANGAQHARQLLPSVLERQCALALGVARGAL